MPSFWVVFTIVSAAVAVLLSGWKSDGSLSEIALHSVFITPYVMLSLLLVAGALLLLVVPFRAIELMWQNFRVWLSRLRAEYIPAGRVKKVAVIGAGSSGLAAAKEALQAGLEVVVFEQTGDVGGNWVFRETEGHASVFRSTVINTSKQMMSFSDFPMSPGTPTYPHHSQIVQYFTDYAKHFDVMHHIRFHSKVVEITPLNEQRWRVFFEKTSEDYAGAPEASFAKIREDDGRDNLDGVESEEFDAVIVCNGHHSVPLWPNFPGQETFKGHMIHSHSYKDVTSCDKGFDFRHKRVLIVGIGNSGADLATEVSRISDKLYLSTRSGAWIVPKYVGGIATDHAWQPARILTTLLPDFIAESSLYSTFEANLFENLVDGVQGNMMSWGIQPTMRINQALITTSQDLLHRIGIGSINMHGNVREVHKDGVTFEDGERVQLDAIIFCTGYLTRFSFLSNSLQPVDSENVVRLYKHIFNPEHATTLAFVGFVQPIGAIMPIAELQSRWVVQVFKGQRGLPCPVDMVRWIDKHLERLWKHIVRRMRHTLQDDYYLVMEDMAEEVGCVPHWWNPTNWKILKELLLSPAGWPCTYRLQGPGAWSGAADALREAYSQIGKHP